MKFFFCIILAFTTAFGNQIPDDYTLTPVTEGNNFHFTNSLVWIENDNARTVLNFNEQAGSFFEFFVVIENKSDSAVLFEPLDIYMEAYTAEDSISEEPEVIYSTDPDEQLEYINKDITSLNKQKNLSDGLNCFFLGLSVAVDAASHVSGSEDEGQTGYILDGIIEEEDEYSYNKFSLEQEKVFWETEVLRGSLIQSGRKTAGTVFIPLSPAAKWIHVVIPFGDMEYVFNFRQTKVPGS